MSRNAAKDGQCTRDAHCTKGKGHAGWCATKGGRSGKNAAQDQGSLLAAAALRRESVRSKPGGRAAAMAELGARRKSSKRSRLEDFEDDEDEDDDDDDDGDDDDEEDYHAGGGSGGGGGGGGGGDDDDAYEEYGMTRAERKAMRRGSTGGGEAEAEAGSSGHELDSRGGQSWPSGGPPAPLAELESIRLERRLLEKWLLEPFFARVVKGCLVRIGLNCDTSEQQPRSTLYRAAEVVGVDEFPDHPYMLGTRRTTKRLHLRFGETRQWYPMASVSNRAFEELELVSWQQVLEVTDDKKISLHQVRAKAKELQEASSHVYSEADVSKRIEEERKQAAQQGKPAVLTTRQKLAMAGGSGDGGPNVSKPKKFERNVLGQAVVADHD
jgi:RNA polymerase-associated protein RTF1